MTLQPTATDCDLLAAVATPDGVTAGPWRVDTDGHLVRDLSDGRAQRGNGDIITQCRHCTVPVAIGDVCSFCDSYTPPETIAQQLDVIVNKIDLVRADGNTVLQSLPREVGLFTVVDLVGALGYLRQAAVLIDRVSDALDAEGVRR